MMIRHVLGFLSILIVVQALGLSITPIKAKHEKSSLANPYQCVSYETLKSDLIIVDIRAGEGIHSQQLNLAIFDSAESLIRSKHEVKNNVKFAFRSLSDATIHVCFDNMILDKSWSYEAVDHDIQLEVTIKKSKLSPGEIEEELLIEEAMKEVILENDAKLSNIISELKNIDETFNYLVEREGTLRDVNENTYSNFIRIQIVIVIGIVVIAILELLYLRIYFKIRKLL